MELCVKRIKFSVFFGVSLMGSIALASSDYEPSAPPLEEVENNQYAVAQLSTTKDSQKEGPTVINAVELVNNVQTLFAALRTDFLTFFENLQDQPAEKIYDCKKDLLDTRLSPIEQYINSIDNVEFTKAIAKQNDGLRIALDKLHTTIIAKLSKIQYAIIYNIARIDSLLPCFKNPEESFIGDLMEEAQQMHASLGSIYVLLEEYSLVPKPDDIEDYSFVKYCNIRDLLIYFNCDANVELLYKDSNIEAYKTVKTSHDFTDKAIKIVAERVNKAIKVAILNKKKT